MSRTVNDALHRKLELSQRAAVDQIPESVKARADLNFWHFLDPDSRSPVFCHAHQRWGFASLNELINEQIGCKLCDTVSETV